MRPNDKLLRQHILDLVEDMERADLDGDYYELKRCYGEAIELLSVIGPNDVDLFAKVSAFSDIA